jgi:hypothetical protein
VSTDGHHRPERRSQVPPDGGRPGAAQRDDYWLRVAVSWHDAAMRWRHRALLWMVVAFAWFILDVVCWLRRL